MLVFFAGTCFGANIWGTMSDRYGRRFGTALSLFVQGAGGVMTSLITDYVWLLVAAGIVGLGIGGGSVTPFSMFSEFLPSEKRGTQLSIYQLAWSLGAVLEIGMAWLIVPSHGWRALALATALPERMYPLSYDFSCLFTDQIAEPCSVSTFPCGLFPARITALSDGDGTARTCRTCSEEDRLHQSKIAALWKPHHHARHRRCT